MKFTIDSRAIPKGRPRVTSHGTYTPKRTKTFEEVVRWSYAASKDKWSVPSDKPLGVTIKCYFIAKKKVDSKWCMMYGDADNMAKAITDALNKLAYLDDKQIVEISVSKRWYYKDCVEVEIKEMEG